MNKTLFYEEGMVIAVHRVALTPNPCFTPVILLHTPCQFALSDTLFPPV